MSDKIVPLDQAAQAIRPSPKDRVAQATKQTNKFKKEKKKKKKAQRSSNKSIAQVYQAMRQLPMD